VEGCDRFQGFYFSQGLAAADFRARLLPGRNAQAPAPH